MAIFDTTVSVCACVHVCVRANVCGYIHVHARAYVCVTFAELQLVGVLSSNTFLLHPTLGNSSHNIRKTNQTF